MRYGVSVGNIQPLGVGARQCVERARRLEELGYDAVWVHDHVAPTRTVKTPYPYRTGDRVEPEERHPRDYLEALTMLAALASATRRVRIGTCVLAAPYRHPAVVAKMVATADRLSRGRCVVGIGDGWQQEEFRVLGIPDEHFEQRFEVTGDYVRALKELWTNAGPSNYVGEYVEFHDIGAYPKPAQKPHPPIVLTAGGPGGFRRASRLANGVQFIAQSPAALREHVDALDRACTADRRDPAEVEVYLMSRVQVTKEPVDSIDRALLQGSVEQIAEDLRSYEASGLQHLIATFDLGVTLEDRRWEDGAEAFGQAFLGRQAVSV